MSWGQQRSKLWRWWPVPLFTTWVLADAWFNWQLHINPLFGRWSHLVEWTHFLIYGILGMGVALSKSPRAFFICLAWCAVDEWIQTLLPNRVCSDLDILRNVIGYLAGYLIIDITRQMRKDGGALP